MPKNLHQIVGLTPLSVCAHVQCWEGDGDNADKNESLFGLSLATRLDKLKILILLKMIGFLKMQLTTSRYPSRNHQEQSECTVFILEGVKVSQNT